jgi:hypothetical protein
VPALCLTSSQTFTRTRRRHSRSKTRFELAARAYPTLNEDARGVSHSCGKGPMPTKMSPTRATGRPLAASRPLLLARLADAVAGPQNAPGAEHPGQGEQPNRSRPAGGGVVTGAGALVFKRRDVPTPALLICRSPSLLPPPRVVVKRPLSTNARQTWSALSGRRRCAPAGSRGARSVTAASGARSPARPHLESSARCAGARSAATVALLALHIGIVLILFGQLVVLILMFSLISVPS